MSKKGRSEVGRSFPTRENKIKSKKRKERAFRSRQIDTSLRTSTSSFPPLFVSFTSSFNVAIFNFLTVAFLFVSFPSRRLRLDPLQSVSDTPSPLSQICPGFTPDSSENPAEDHGHPFSTPKTSIRDYALRVSTNLR